jgi:hypothetical protein
MRVAQEALLDHEKAVRRARPARAPVSEVFSHGDKHADMMIFQGLRIPTIVISDSEPEEDDGEGDDDNDARPAPSRRIFQPTPEPANFQAAGPSRRRGPFNLERLVRGMEEADRQQAREDCALRRARFVMDEAENDPYGPIF